MHVKARKKTMSGTRLIIPNKWNMYEDIFSSYDTKFEIHPRFFVCKQCRRFAFNKQCAAMDLIF